MILIYFYYHYLQDKKYNKQRVGALSTIYGWREDDDDNKMKPKNIRKEKIKCLILLDEIDKTFLKHCTWK